MIARRISFNKFDELSSVAFNRFQDCEKTFQSFEPDLYFVSSSFEFDFLYSSRTDLTSHHFGTPLDPPSELHSPVDYSSPAIDNFVFPSPTDGSSPHAALGRLALTVDLAATQPPPTWEHSFSSTSSQASPLTHPHPSMVAPADDKASSSENFKPSPSPLSPPSSTSLRSDPSAHIQCTWNSCNKHFSSIRD